jgi:hypothetical protein
MSRDAELVAVGERRRADGDGRIGARDDLAREVDAGDEWADPRHLAVDTGGEPVLVVDARPADPDLDLAGRQVGLMELADPAVEARRVGVQDALGDVGSEGLGDGGHRLLDGGLPPS